MKSKFVLLIVLQLFLALSIFGESFKNAEAKTNKILNSIVEKKDIVGATVTVGIKDKIVMSKGYGLIDIENKIKTQPYHKYRIYSISKHITAIAAAKLAEEGKLDLDAPIVKYIPFINDKLKKVTTRQLVGHIAGVRSYREGEWQKVSSGVCISPFESILSFQNDELLFKPGDKYSYTSFGYVLLSAVIEKASNKSFVESVNETFFTPLGIKDLTLDNSNEADFLRAKPYEYYKEKMYPARYANNTCKFGGGGFTTSTPSIVKFNLALLNGKIVNDKTLKTIFTSIKLNNGKETGYGFGLQFEKDKSGRKFAWHSGRSRGGRNALVIYPKEKVVVAISSNTNGDGIVTQAESIAQEFLKEMAK